jgi:hypothetical protein
LVGVFVYFAEPHSFEKVGSFQAQVNTADTAEQATYG